MQRRQNRGYSDLPTHCKVCGKKLNALEILFYGAYCALHKR